MRRQIHLAIADKCLYNVYINVYIDVYSEIQQRCNEEDLQMANLTLWTQLQEWKSPRYKWVELTHELSPETPHWYGFKPLQADTLFDYAESTPEDKLAPIVAASRSALPASTARMWMCRFILSPAGGP